MIVRTLAGLDVAPTTHARLLAWVRTVAELTEPERVEWLDAGTTDLAAHVRELVVAENDALDPSLDASLDTSLDAFLDGSGQPSPEPADPARTFVCTRQPSASSGTWMDPEDMKAILTDRFHRSMRGRPLFVLPYLVAGPAAVDASTPTLGVQLTDSAAAVAALLRVPARRPAALDAFTSGTTEHEFARGLHSLGRPRNGADPSWPHTPPTYVAHFPEERLVWSFGTRHPA